MTNEKRAKIEIQFTPKRDTKNTVLFQEEEDPEERWSEPRGFAIGPLYIQTQALEHLAEPLKIGRLKVTIEVLELLESPRAKL